jgi:hypothetical protein
VTKALLITAAGKTLLLSAAWVLLGLSFIDIVFVMFSVDVLTALIAGWLWGEYDET